MRGDDVSGDEGFETVEMLRQFAFAFRERRSGSGECWVFPATQGVDVDDLGCGCLDDAFRCEQITEPSIHMGEWAVFAYGQTPRVSFTLSW